jgi:predicted RNA-binding protein YlxR (DUF448 family)
VERTCVGCGGKADPAGLVRLAADAGGRLVHDARRRLGGRGAWLHPGGACLARAQKRRAFGRALRLEGLAVDGAGLERLLTELGRKD